MFAQNLSCRYVKEIQVGREKNLEALRNQSVYIYLEVSCNCSTFVNSFLNKLVITLNGQGLLITHCCWVISPCTEKKTHSGP